MPGEKQNVPRETVTFQSQREDKQTGMTRRMCMGVETRTVWNFMEAKNFKSDKDNNNKC